MTRSLLATIAVLALTTSALADELMPLPASLEPAVRFWTRVYTEVDGNSGFIHDTERLGVVYEVVRLSPKASKRSRERQVENAKDRIRNALRKLSGGKRTGLTADEASVLSQWPDDVSNKTLKSASHRLRFQLGQADRFRAGLERSGAWRAYIEKTMRDHGVPVELANLPHVESSFNPNAYSRVGAAGLWQFTRSTGKRYLHVDHVVDERMDPFAATIGAARLLRENYRLTKSWPLAITSYNHGAAGMRRAVAQVGTNDMGRIVASYKSRTFGFASRNFYTSFLAAKHVDANAEHYFGKITKQQPVAYTIVELPHYYPSEALSRALGIGTNSLREHNRALRPSVWNGSKFVPKGFRLRVPSANLAGDLPTLLAGVPSGERHSQQHRDRYYKVRRGDSLSKIASRFAVSQRELVALNNLKSRHSIRAGQVLVLPDDAAGATIVVARQERPSDGVYVVRRGDNLNVISKRFGVSEAGIAQANGIRNKNRIAVGQRLAIPGATRALAAEPIVVASTEPPPPAAKPKPVAKPEPVPVAKPEPEPAKPEPVPVAKPEPEPAKPEPVPVAKPEPEPAKPVAKPAEPEAPAATPEPEVVVVATAPEPIEPSVERPNGNGIAKAVPDPSDYAVHGSRITVQADETLGHYAEWLEIRASEIRGKNNLKFGQDLVIGRRLRLVFSKVTPEEFEQLRLAYHRDLQEEFFEAYAVTGTENHVLEKGESLWYLANKKYQLPVWLLRQYNPDLDFGTLNAGVSMVVPTVEARKG